MVVMSSSADSQCKGSDCELARISAEVNNCRKCPLYLSRKKTVPGEGNPKAEVMLIGEAPGRVEDETGRPFVGAAGKLLDELLREIGVNRGDLYITNVVKCRPPNNRDPTEEEINSCKPYLIRQIAAVRPKKMITLGRHSTRVILNLGGLGFSELTKVRGKVFRVNVAGVNVEVYPTYHPAAALYNPPVRSVIKEDLARALSINKGGSSILDYLNG